MDNIEVYVVIWSDGYNLTNVEGIFSTYEKALKFIGDDSCYHIKAYEVDDELTT